MREISLHIIDIVQNSIYADATLIEIRLLEDINNNLLKVIIKDNGKGMDVNTLQSVSNPFFTERKTRKVGLGIPLFKMAAEQSGGDLQIESIRGQGTTIKANFIYNHIDRAPIGDMGETILTLVICNPNIDFIYQHGINNKSFKFETKKIKGILKETKITEPEVIQWIKEFLKDNLLILNGGAGNEEFS